MWVTGNMIKRYVMAKFAVGNRYFFELGSRVCGGFIKR